MTSVALSAAAVLLLLNSVLLATTEIRSSGSSGHACCRGLDDAALGAAGDDEEEEADCIGSQGEGIDLSTASWRSSNLLDEAALLSPLSAGAPLLWRGPCGACIVSCGCPGSRWITGPTFSISEACEESAVDVL